MRNIKYVIFLFITSFLFLNNAHADAVCTYKYSVGEFKCTVSYRNGVSCTDPVNRNNPNEALVKRMGSITLNTNDFIKNGKIVCASALYADALLDNENDISVLKYYDLNTDGNCTEAIKHYTPAPGTINKGGCTALYLTSQEYSADNDTGVTTPSTGNSGNTGNTNPSGGQAGSFGTGSAPSPTEGGDNFNPQSFCSKTETKNVFRGLGYVFFIVKIVIPIIIIALASIDFAKAIFASKDDEIKKTAKTLMMRVIAGIIIFFVPTILNFVIKLIPTGANNPDNLYNENTGTFKECTSCMLEPFSCK